MFVDVNNMLPIFTNEFCRSEHFHIFLSVCLSLSSNLFGYWSWPFEPHTNNTEKPYRIYCCLKWCEFQLTLWIRMRCHFHINFYTMCLSVCCVARDLSIKYHIYTVKVDTNMIWHVKMRHLSHCVTYSHLLLFISLIAVFYA